MEMIHKGGEKGKKSKVKIHLLSRILYFFTNFIITDIWWLNLLTMTNHTDI